MPYKQRILLSTIVIIGTFFIGLCGCKTDVINQPQSKQQESTSPEIPTQLKTLYDYFVQFQQDRNQEHFQQGVSKLTTYYCSGGYEFEVSKRCNEARDYFSTIPATQDSLIIFDIDDTALYSYQKYDELITIWKYNYRISYIADDEAPAIQPVLNLYNFLIARGFTIAFLSSRKDIFLSETIVNLHYAGYNPHTDTGIPITLKIILMPSEEKAKADLSGAWKHEERKKLAREYTIVGCIGDHTSDFYFPKTHECSSNCCCTGHVVSLPNYLY